MIGVRGAPSTLFVLQMRKPIGKSPFSPSNALLWTMNPLRYSAFQNERNSLKFGALMYFNFENTATVAFGISLAMRKMNCVNSSRLANPRDCIESTILFVLETPSLFPLPVPLPASA